MKKIAVCFVTIMLAFSLVGCAEWLDEDVRDLEEGVETTSDSEETAQNDEEDEEIDEIVDALSNLIEELDESETSETVEETVAPVDEKEIADADETEYADENEAVKEADTSTEDENQADEDTDNNAAGSITFTTYGTVNLNTHDYYGNSVTNDIFSGYTVTMVNIWAPWCGPCVGEMPELEQLYQNYKNKGFQIIGAAYDMDDPDMADVLSYTGVTYPIVEYDNSMDPYSSEYVPTTFFVDSQGNVITSESYIGSMDYSSWERAIKQYLP